MKLTLVRLYLPVVLLAALVTPAMADGNPIPWPHTFNQTRPVVAVDSPKLVADGNPIPWPHILSPVGPAGVVDGTQLIPRPEATQKPISAPPMLMADGNPIPWPHKAYLDR
jgi:hypothetical protein